jgi:hypothetical protein
MTTVVKPLPVVHVVVPANDGPATLYTVIDAATGHVAFRTPNWQEAQTEAMRRNAISQARGF